MSCEHLEGLQDGLSRTMSIHPEGLYDLTDSHDLVCLNNRRSCTMGCGEVQVTSRGVSQAMQATSRGASRATKVTSRGASRAMQVTSRVLHRP